MATAADIQSAIAELRTYLDTRLDAIEKKLEARTSAPVLPAYGRRKGEPILGAPIADLEWYAGNCRKSLADPGKSRWHDREREMLAKLEAEIARQGGNVAPPQTADGLPVDDNIPF